MRVNLIKAKSIRDFAQQHASSAHSFEDWIAKIESADWEIPGDMKHTFPTVDFLGMGSNRVIFNVGGNNFRMICSYYFNGKIGTATLFVKWIGTHGEYDRLCNLKKQYSVNHF